MTLWRQHNEAVTHGTPCTCGCDLNHPTVQEDTMTDIDTSDLDAAPAAVQHAYNHRPQGARVYLVTTYADGSTWHRTGYIGKTTGTRPGFLVISRISDYGSSDLLTASTWENTVVAGISQSYGSPYYIPGLRTADKLKGVRYSGLRVLPGHNRYEEVSA